MRTVTIKAKTIDAAVEEGLKQLGISREEAVVHIVEQPSSGLFGLIRKKMAVVEISAPDLMEEEPSTEEKPTEEPKEETPVSEEKPEESTETSPEEKKEEPAEEKTEEKEETPSEETPAEEREEKPAKGKEEFVFSAEDQAKTAEDAKAFLANVFKGMNLDVTMETMMNEERILLNLHGDGLGILIGKHGQTLDALQYLTNLASGKEFHHHYFVLLDVENYRERRKDTLEALARRIAGKVKRTGEPVKLEPMAAGERRIIHLALQNDNAITTDSEGEAPHRYVVIRLKD
ncbi:RNA-binding cell elongation regulator Jag/EloR [Dialister sp.]|uniref:RNA-binding cell elongation regulator Jag/EloR n=1 Tax=Dialister sp. TaxID=1955814 RepID=UPI002E80AC3F|nr:RNA-binding cell elongation regulator Jag/EloR [Dialister sp.]MEE3453770.1 RNA-binding cell elongation regulator Jag/EloR [Dialister sp.]